MTIPRQPRTKASSPAAASRAAEPAAEADKAYKASADLQQASAGASEAIGTAYLNAHKEQVVAYVGWLEKLIASAGAGTAPEAYAGAAPADVEAATQAHRNYLLAHVDQQVAGQKALLEAASTYVQALKESQDRLDEQVRQHNQGVADALKDALVKTDVRPDNVQSLALLYHALTTMGTTGGGTVTA
jgi:hypothetical protein